MSTYWLGVITIPALLVAGVIVWFVGLVAWQEILTKTTNGYECACGKWWGQSFEPWKGTHSGHNHITAKFLAWKHCRKCRHNILDTEYWRSMREAIKENLPNPVKPQELKDLDAKKWEDQQ